MAPARVGDAEGAGTSPGNIRAKPKRALAEMVKQKSKDSSSDPTSHQTTDQTSGFSGRRGPAAARGFSPRTRPQPAAWPTLRVFLRSVCLSLQTPCKYFRNSAKCPQCAGISPGPGRPPVPGGAPSPGSAARPGTPRDAGLGSCPPVGGQRQTGMRLKPCQRCRQEQRVAAGAAPRAGPERLGKGRRDPSAPRRRRFWPVRASGGAEPLPARSRSSASSAMGTRGVRAARGAPSPLRQGRAPAPAPLRLPGTSRPAGRAGPLPVPPGLSAQMSLLRIKKRAGRWEVGGQCFSPSSSHGGKSWQAEAACKSDGETALPLLFPVPSPPVPGVVRGARLKVRTCF